MILGQTKLTITNNFTKSVSEIQYQKYRKLPKTFYRIEPRNLNGNGRTHPLLPIHSTKNLKSNPLLMIRNLKAIKKNSQVI